MKAKIRFLLLLLTGLSLVLLHPSCKKKPLPVEPDDLPPVVKTGCGSLKTVVDGSGNMYQVVQIGGQCWLQSNLRARHYLNGDAVYEVFDSASWAFISISKIPVGMFYSTAQTEKEDSIQGKLYNYYAFFHPAKLCPAGFRIPSDADWNNLEITLGMAVQDTARAGWRSPMVGDSLKHQDAEFWPGSADRAPNSTGFSAVPTGFINHFGNYTEDSKVATFWTTDSLNENFIWYRRIADNQDGIFRDVFFREAGLSCRCVKDL